MPIRCSVHLHRPAEWHQSLLSGSYTTAVAEAARKLRHEALQELSQLYDAAFTSLRIDATLRDNWCIIPDLYTPDVRDTGYEDWSDSSPKQLLDRLYPIDLPPPGSPAPACNWRGATL